MPRWPILLLAPALCTPAATVSPLLERAYTVVPQPQRIQLQAGDFQFGSEWHIALGPGVEANSSAIESLREGLQDRFGVTLSRQAEQGPSVKLVIDENSVRPGVSQDQNTKAIAEQAYRLDLQPSGITITANASPGLFYGVETLIQLLKPENGGLALPEGEMEDWPDLELRQIYWDDAHHLEKLSDLKAAVRQAAFFKINGFIIKLDGHFQYSSAPAAVEPQALSPAELQELTDYGLRYHVQVIPYLDAPGHISFVLKHPEYAQLRAFPDSNYELCTTNPSSFELLKGMYNDLLNANRGVKYFYLSTDEPYYVGMVDNQQCQEAAHVKELGSRGKLLAQFVTQTADYLHQRGREVVFWGEYPLQPEDINSLPAFLINGETTGEKFDRLYKARGIRQMTYQATEGEEPLFPHYFLLPPSRRLHPLQEDFERVSNAISQIVSDTGRQDADLMGLVTAGWGDVGLHPETFWLGYATISAAGWHVPAADASEAMSAFYPLWFGPSVRDMGRVYQLMSFQAQTWADSWETKNSTARKPIWGNSDRIFSPPVAAHDQTISLPVPPSEQFGYAGGWTKQNSERLRLVDQATAESDEALQLLEENLRLAKLHRYDLEVFVAIAELCRQNLHLLTGLRRIDEGLVRAATAAQQGRAREAVSAVDGALAEMRQIKKERDVVLRDATETFSKDWLPRVPEANGRHFLHEMDDVKDHLPDRTVDLSYLVYRELLLPVGEWYGQTEAARNKYASAHQLPVHTVAFSWNRTE